MNRVVVFGFLTKIAAGGKEASLQMAPLGHQSRVSEKLHDTPGVLVYHGLGSGKTFSAINAAEDHGLPLIAITPASLRENFKKEISASGFSGPSTVMSYEEATKRMSDPDFQEQASKSLVVFDEAHRMGRAESARSKLPKHIRGAKTMLLTGTPMRNRPEELMPLLLASDPKLRIDPKEFKQRFIGIRQVHPGFFAAMRGIPAGEEEVAKNLSGFKQIVKGKVDYHEAYDPENYPTSEEEIIDVKMTPTQNDAYKFVLNKYPALAYKIKHGIPPNRKDIGKMHAFMTAPRQISNTPETFALKSKPEDAAKIIRAVDEIEKHKEEDKNFRGVVYSTYLGSGIDPMAAELERRGIDHIRFTGQLNDNQKRDAVKSYNSGLAPVMLISGAGAEGLDLKGTKLMQILEPHWNEELINQVKGRAIRYKSHSHLPEDERNVKVQRFHSKINPGMMHKLMRDYAPNFIRVLAPSYFKEPKGADEYLYDMSMRKQKLNEQFLNILKEQK
jgi:SNF2 family DNA or RNA helicase